MAESNAKIIKHTAGTQTAGKVTTTSSTTTTTTKPAVSSYLTKVKRDIVREDVTLPISVSEARKIAFALHDGDKDKLGAPYGAHLEAVRQGVVVLGGGVEEQIAALMHDAVEDLHTTYDAMRKAGFTEDTITMVEAVSKRYNEVQNEYLDRIIAAGPGAMRVKVADLLHNLRHDRVEKLQGYLQDRLAKKYRPALARLLMELNLIMDEDGQKKLATKPVGSATGTTTYASKTSKEKRKSLIPSMIKGDWPDGFPAPVIERMTKYNEWPVRFMLANGEILEIPKPKNKADESMGYYSKMQYKEYSDITFPGVEEEDILAYLKMV